METLAPDFLARLASAAGEFQAAQPFAHGVFDSVLAPDAADRVLAEFVETSVQESSWSYYHHYNEKKRAVTDAGKMGPATRRFLDEAASPRFIAALEKLSGISGLLWDPELDGAGLHETKPGGFLNVHVDFRSHTTRRTWSRQLNLILFLNKDWRDEYNGGLEFWDRPVKNCARRISPVFNRAVIFHTGPYSVHGVPAPVLCPAGESRKSIALYYFCEERRPLRLSPTFYKPRPEDSLRKRALIVADRLLLRVYSYLKRYGGLADRMASVFLRRL